MTRPCLLAARSTLVLAALLAVASAASAACGYTPVHAGFQGEGKQLHVALAGSSVPDAVASDEVLASVREELARYGLLAPGDGYPRCEIEILRADESSEGIAAAGGAGEALVPQSRATRVGMVGRAWVVRAAGSARERDTGDLRALETIAVASDARAATFRHGDALRAAGRRLGRRLASRLAGLPAASEE